MLKKINELSKTELMSFIYNNIENFRLDSTFECVVCGKYSDADWGYICDNCDCEGDE